MYPRNLWVEHRTDARTAFAMVVLLITGEFVDGKPLYRFPIIEAVGSRSSIRPGT